MSKIYILGGGPGAGKSTVADALSKQFGIKYIKCDLLVDEHQQAAADEKYPVNSYINGLPKDEQPLELIKLSMRQEIARQQELFFMLLKELRQHHYDDIILEGNALLPRLVKERFELPYQAVWLVPTFEQQKQVIKRRKWAMELVQRAAKPSLTLDAWLERDRQFNEHVREQAEQLGLPYLIIDGKQSLAHTVGRVVQKLELAQASEPA